MIGKITPLVKEAGRRVWTGAVLSHTAGALLSACVQGLILGSLGLAIGVHSWQREVEIAGCVVLLACAVRDVDLFRWPMPSPRRQTPSWFACAFGPFWGSFAWGLDLAQGWTTGTTLAGYYAIAFCSFATSSALYGALVLGSYGFGRVIPVAIAGLLADRFELSVLSTAYGRRLPRLQWINGLLLSCVAGYFVVGALN